MKAPLNGEALWGGGVCAACVVASRVSQTAEWPTLEMAVRVFAVQPEALPVERSAGRPRAWPSAVPGLPGWKCGLLAGSFGMLPATVTGQAGHTFTLLTSVHIL